MQKKSVCLMLVIIGSLLIIKPLQALNIEHFRPNFDNLGLINLQDHQTLAEKSWSLGSGFSFAHDPFQLGLVSTGATVQDLVGHQTNVTLNAAYGLIDWLTVGLTIPFFPSLEVQPIGSTVSQSTSSFGDISLDAKMDFWEQGDEQKDNIVLGLAFSPFLTFPSGDTSKFTGDKNVTGGVNAIFDASFWKNKIVTNVGFRFRQLETVDPNLVVGQEFLFGLGFTRPIWEPWDFHFLTELNGSTSLDGSGKRESLTPVEWLFGLRKGFLKSRLNATLGAGAGLTNGYGTPDVRGFGMLTYVYRPSEPKKEVPPPAPETAPVPETYAKVEGNQIVILQPIHFETAKWVILPESLPIVQSVADLMKSRPDIQKVLIEGHTDWRGSDQYNLNLSNHRAHAVRDKLIEFGIAPEKLDAVGRGESQPVADNKTEEGMAKNRRVEFHIIEVQK